MEDIWRTQWQGELFFSHGTNHSCGVMILVRNDLDFKLKAIQADNEGRYITIEAEVQSSNFLFANIYAPNKVQEQCQFFDKLNKTIEDLVANEERKIVIGGDFNVALDTELDCSGGNPSKKDSIKNIYDLCLDFDLVDIWRIRNPEIKRFTWRQKSPLIQRRLDYWLISDVCQEDIEKSDIIPSINSDHSAIFIHFNNIEKQKHGPSFWKFNSSLVEDEDFVTLINESMPIWLQEFESITDKRLLWDLIKYRIRQVSTKFAKEKARKKRQKITDVENNLKACEENCGRCPSPENIQQLEVLKSEYESIYDNLAQGAIVRSKATWYEKGEKSNKYFLNLESHKKAKSSVRKVFNRNGILVTHPKDVLKEIEKYYSNLYKADSLASSEISRNAFLENPHIPKLTAVNAETCEGKLTVAECFECLQTFENNKSPGDDGLTAEFYKAFWNILGNLLVDSLNYSYDHGELSNSQKRAIITLIEKKDKDRRDISNWRPISLINVDVKIGSKAIAKRLEVVLPSIIHHNQCAYVKNRTICDAVRSIEDILDYTKRYHIQGRLVSIDFKKAFDSVSRDFLFRTLAAFQFGPSFTRWIHTFYNNISSCVLNNGFSTAPFEIQRGVRQGDPLSSCLFIIVLEILAINIRSCESIQGIKVDGEEIKLGIFADDLTAFLLNDFSLLKFLELLEKFGECSGLKINNDKSEILVLGDCTNPSLNHNLFTALKVKTSVKILGIHFTYDNRVKQKLNSDALISSIKEKLKIWRWRDLTIIGKIQIVKTFIIPIFLYRASMICLNKEFVNEANKIIFDFIWKGKDKVKRLALVSDIEDGGLKAPHLDSIIKTQRILCCKRFANEQPSTWKSILLHYLKPVGGKFILACDFEVKTLPIRLPLFYEECLKCFAEHSASRKIALTNISKVIIWNNKAIRVGGKSVYNHNLASVGIIRIGDLITDDKELITTHRLRELNISPLDAFNLIGLIEALPDDWRKLLSTRNVSAMEPFNLQNEVQLNLNGQNIPIGKAVSKTVYKEIRNRIIAPPTAQLKYNCLFENDDLDWNKIYSLPHRVALDTKSREFQYKLLNRCLPTNAFLNKIGIVASPACSFCGETDESLEHLFLTCHYITKFWGEVIKWLKDQGIQIAPFSNKEIMFGIIDDQENLFINHILLIAKKHIYSCRYSKIIPSIKVLTAKIKRVHQLETTIARSSSKWPTHIRKWGKYKEV